MSQSLDGLWRLVSSEAFDGETRLAPPYGTHPMGQILFSGGRMLAALCNGDHSPEVTGGRNFSSYGGPCTFDGTTLVTTVDVASDPTRIGGQQVREVVRLDGDRIMLRPPVRDYAGQVQRRELVWQRVWRPA